MIISIRRASISVPLDRSNVLGNTIASAIVNQDHWARAWCKDRDSDCMRRTCASEHAHTAMNVATKCAEKVSFQRRSYDKTDIAQHCVINGVDLYSN